MTFGFICGPHGILKGRSLGFSTMATAEAFYQQEYPTYSLGYEPNFSQILSNKPKGGLMGLFKNLVLKKAQKYAEQSVKKSMETSFSPQIGGGIAQPDYHVSQYVIETMNKQIRRLENSVRLLRDSLGVRESSGPTLRKMTTEEKKYRPTLASDICETSING